jgi:hypothetical protein
MDYDTDDSDDSDSRFASHNHVESDIEENFEEAKQQEDDEDDNSDDGWTYPKNETYQPYIVSFMSFTHNRTYPATTEFTKEQLLAIKPHHVKKWLNNRAYHTPMPTEQDRPIYQRAGSLKKAKQALSFYHPNKHVPWLEGRGGNPTIHSTLNALIQRVDTFEVRNLGKKANDKRPYTREEFNKKLELCRDVNDFNHSVKYVTMTLWAKHLIHRVDDTCRFMVSAPHGNPEFPFTIKTRTKWSKNVRSFKNCPDQIILGSKLWSDCVLLHLAWYLEQWIGRNVPTVKFLVWTAGEDEEKAPKH